MNVGDRLNVQIQSLAYGGDSIARTPEGFVLFISGGVPGDELEVEVTDKKKSFGSARLLKVLKASPDRRLAPCPVFGTCGGCQWQHIHYEAQLRFKNEMIRGALKKTAYPVDQLQAIVASPREFHYRNRIQVRVQGETVGFFAKSSHRIVATDTCEISLEPLVEAMQKLPRNRTGQARKVELKLLPNQEVVSDSDSAHGQHLGFSQANDFANQDMICLLIEQIKVWTESVPIHTIWDLYAGAGNLTWPLSQIPGQPKVRAVEYNVHSVDAGQVQARAREVSDRVTFKADKVELWLKQQKSETPDLVVLDPPRMGCDPRALDLLLKIAPQFIIFIGCDLNHYIRDTRALLAGYHLERLVPFDFFPQTYHVEMVGFFRRM